MALSFIMQPSRAAQNIGFGLTLLLLSPSLCEANPTTAEVISSIFQRIPIRGTYLELYDSDTTGAVGDSTLACARECAERRTGVTACRAFNYLPQDRKCDMYKTGVNLVDASSGLQVFLRQYSRDRFESIYVNGQHFSIYLSSAKKTFFEARRFCEDLGGYLLQFDSQDEVEAVKQLVPSGGTGEISYVGANDVTNDGDWRNDKGGLPLTQNAWPWEGGTPGSADEIEEAAGFSHQSRTVLEFDLTQVHSFLCEKDP